MAFKYIIFTVDGVSLPIAYKLQEEGNDVTVAFVQDYKELEIDKDEDPEDKKKRLSLYDGMVDKVPAKDVLKAMAKVKNKDEYFIFCDTNNLWKYGEAALKLGYTKGLFPTKEDITMEDDRNKAKEFVKKYYKDVKVGEVHEFKTIDDGIQFLEESEELWVLKSNSEEPKTDVPETKDPEVARQYLIEKLQEYKSDYESQGYILERMIIDGHELTPEIIFWNGTPVMTTVDIETKPIGAGNTGFQVGCNQNLIIKTELDDKINVIAFPEIIYEKAQKTPGIFIWDAGLIKEGDDYYFTEFCSQRFGYDSIFTEIAMAGSATNFFESIARGKNPLIKTFGTAVRLFILPKHTGDNHQGTILHFDEKIKDSLWIYDGKKEKNDIVTVNVGSDIAVVTAAADTINDAVDENYEAVNLITFKGLYKRPKFDFMSEDYTSSIPNRFNEFNHEVFEVPDIENDNEHYDKRLKQEKEKFENKSEELKKNYESELESIRLEIKGILHDNQGAKK